MLCYKEVHKYNGEYFSRYDNGYKFVVGEIAKPSGDNFIYATDTIENVLSYAYVPYDMAILELEIVDGTEWHKKGYVITAKAVKVLREVSEYERNNESERIGFCNDKDTSKLYGLLQERRKCLMSSM